MNHNIPFMLYLAMEHNTVHTIAPELNTRFFSFPPKWIAPSHPHTVAFTITD